MSNYDSCHTSLNALNRLIEEKPFHVEIDARYDEEEDDPEMEWQAVVYGEDGELMARTSHTDSYTRALTNCVETLGVIV
jgi:hypothetical protein